jgi:hypothetical protein
MSVTAVAFYTPAPTRFETHREAASARATLELASILAEQARDAAERARKLFAAASGSDPSARKTATAGALQSAQEAHRLLGEIIGEMVS